ncbi:acetamidase/formamidase family protein [Crassaminicella profunda]|uniref:acetamidase/formamidase family protein n=1 Tax=Crassaminicella profunda TaxID=1286698 RepID=UPI001CA72E10|nr:acetamidase/formamidase family protein [Crassaminicella profunda]QZY56163.1 acetamidase/formamidase family protein [Crassaminicella profunda]
MKKIKRDNSIFTMSKKNKPIKRINSGETIVFETYDCYNNQIKSEDQLFSTIKSELNNPATGPLYIEEAEVGDILKVQIIDIKINDKGVMAARPNSGVLGEFFKESKSKIIPIKDHQAIFNEKIQIPINPMIGVIGVAPEGEDVKTTVPDMHGGNMDCKRIVKGSTVYLTVNAKGGLLSIGDLHAVMGDGEIVICALEVDGEVMVKVNVIKNKELPLPMVVEGEHIMTIASKKTLDAAAKQATINMHKFLINELNMDTYEAGMLLSLVGDLKICQVVDPLMTARMEFPKSILNQYNYKMF